MSLRIVRLANFVTPGSGGLRTALRELGAGYLAAGHEPVLVVPGERYTETETPQGRIVTLPGPVLPRSGGYRVLADRGPVRRLLENLAPDRLEVSDRTTLRWTGEWARRARVPAVMVSHETADGVLRTWGAPAPVARRLADALNSRTAHAYTRVVCTTAWAEREFRRIGARNVVRAPLGVDLERCRPQLRDEALRQRHARVGEVLLVLCSRLSVEKRPGTALDCLEALRARGVQARLVVAGDGPLRGRLERRARARGLPVAFLGHVADRAELATLQATADVCLAPGPAETFGLAALEALACGTPVVVNALSALPEIVGVSGPAEAEAEAAVTGSVEAVVTGSAGGAVTGSAGGAECAAGAAALGGEGFADAVGAVLARSERDRRQAARARAECFGWDRAVAAFLGAHEVPGSVPVLAAGGGDGSGPAMRDAEGSFPVVRDVPGAAGSTGRSGAPVGATDADVATAPSASGAAGTVPAGVRGAR